MTSAAQRDKQYISMKERQDYEVFKLLILVNIMNVRFGNYENEKKKVKLPDEIKFASERQRKKQEELSDVILNICISITLYSFKFWTFPGLP